MKLKFASRSLSFIMLWEQAVEAQKLSSTKRKSTLILNNSAPRQVYTRHRQTFTAWTSPLQSVLATVDGHEAKRCYGLDMSDPDADWSSPIADTPQLSNWVSMLFASDEYNCFWAWYIIRLFSVYAYIWILFCLWNTKYWNAN